MAVGDKERAKAATTTSRLPPVGFWSYARQDDQLSSGRLSALRALLMQELQQQYGREPIHLFQDANTIPHGSDWEKEIKKALQTATFFIPIVTPNFVQSEWCCREVELFVERERQLGTLHPELAGTSRIFPILFIGVDDVDPENPEMLAALQKLQWFDFRPYRHRDFSEASVREALSELAGSMRSLLKRRIGPPAADPPPAASPAQQPSGKTSVATVITPPSEPAPVPEPTEPRPPKPPEPPSVPEPKTTIDAAIPVEAEVVERPDEPARARHWVWPSIGLAALAAILVLILRPGSEPESVMPSAGPTRKAGDVPALSPGAVAMRDALAAVPQAQWLSQDLPYAIDRRIWALGTLGDMRALAQSGNARAQVLIGQAYDVPDHGAPHDLSQAMAWYRLAAASGDGRALHHLGFMYGNSRGVDRDEAEALRWYRRAADAGNVYAMAAVGASYAYGRSVARDDAEAMRWYRRAVEGGNTHAMIAIGNTYAEGRGIPRNDAEAARWYRRAVDAGNGLAMIDLGVMYANGRGVARDQAEAQRWFQRAVEAKGGAAMYNLGGIYAEGRVMARDDAEAVRWYRRAVDAGFLAASYDLGIMYAEGRGVARDEAQAIYWFRRAAELGSPNARQELTRRGIR